MAIINYKDGQLVLPDSLETITTYVLQEQGDWFEDDIQFLREHLSDATNIIDIGANYGVYSVCFAKQCRGKVYAFEPVATTFDFLKQSVAQNNLDNLIVEQCAVSNQNGTGYIATGSHAELNRLSNDEQGEQVELVSLDEYLPENETIDFIKIDAEGHEIDVLKGMQKLIEKQHPSMMFEIVSDDSGLDLAVMDFYRTHGYKIYQLLPGYNRLVELDSEKIDPFIINAYAIYPGGLLQEYVCSIDDITTPEINIKEYFESCPYARSLDFDYDNCDANYQSALQHYIASQSANGCDSVQHAFKAFEILTSIKSDNIFYTVSYLRVAYELGNRQTSNHEVMKLLEKFGELAPTLAFTTPFLAVSDTFSNKEITSEPAMWLGASLLHILDQKIAHSSWYSNASSLDNLKTIQELGYATQGTKDRTRVILQRYTA